MKVTKPDEFHQDYCSRKQTSTLNAIFTLLIFLSHSTQYVNLGGTLDGSYISFKKYIGQLVVAGFLFYSGYGIMESIGKKGKEYVNSIPSKRLFRTWYHFALALLGFLAVNLIFNIKYKPINIILSFTGYKAIGNSNWYMFVTFCMYIIIFAAFKIGKCNKWLSVGLVFAFTVLFAFAESKIGLELRYYNTIFCMPAGMLFSLIKPKFDKVVMKNDIVWSIATALIFAVYYFFSKERYENVVYHNLFAILAVMLITMITMKIKIENNILDFFANHIFSFFILQRIPMIALNEMGFSRHKYGFIIVSFAATVVLSLIFDKITEYTDKLIYKPKTSKS